MTPSGKTICILPQQLGLGGPHTFRNGLADAFTRRGMRISSNPLAPDNSAILVIGGTRRIAELRRAKNKGIRVVQRLNGMNWVQRVRFTGVKHFVKAEVGNLLLAAIRRLADRVVYQSEFAQGWWERSRGVVAKPQTVIYNGTDLSLFQPGEFALPVDKYRLLLVEGHHGGGYQQGLFSAVELADQLNQRLEKQVELVVVGDVPPLLRQQAQRPGVIIDWRGVMAHAEIPELERTAHLLYATDVNAACPNTVIEALACGLPVVAFATGSMPELVREGAGKLAAYGADVWKLEPPDVHALAEAALEILRDRERFSLQARQRALAHFDVEQMAERYLDFLLGD